MKNFEQKDTSFKVRNSLYVQFYQKKTNKPTNNSRQLPSRKRSSFLFLGICETTFESSCIIFNCPFKDNYIPFIDILFQLEVFQVLLSSLLDTQVAKNDIGILGYIMPAGLGQEILPLSSVHQYIFCSQTQSRNLHRISLLD